MRGGAHAHCCKGLAGVRVRRCHNPLVHEWAHYLSLAGRHVEVEVRDPDMGEHARLDVVEYPTDEGLGGRTMSRSSPPCGRSSPTCAQ